MRKGTWDGTRGLGNQFLPHVVTLCTSPLPSPSKQVKLTDIFIKKKSWQLKQIDITCIS